MSQLEKSSDQSCAGGQCWPLPGDHVTRDQYLAISRFIRRNILFIILFTIEYLQSLAPHIWPADTDHGADSIKGLIIWLRCWWEWQIYMMDSETQKLREGFKKKKNWNFPIFAETPPPPPLKLENIHFFFYMTHRANFFY